MIEQKFSYERIYIIGAQSGIATTTLPLIEFENVKQTHIVRDSSKYMTMHNVMNFADTEQILVEESKKKRKILVLNFAGSFGDYDQRNSINVDKNLQTIDENIRPAIFALNLVLASGFESTLIGFSGAGVGGNNLEIENTGYLMAKASICVLFEAMAKLYSEERKNFILIAPGPFPTKMQKQSLLTTSSLVSEKKRETVLRNLLEPARSSQLASLMINLIKTPEKFNGMTISLLHDNLLDFENSQNPQIGKLRRVFD